MEYVTDLNWRKSTYSSNAAECVEAASRDGMVLVRDSKANSNGPVHRYPAAEWRALLAAIRNGEFGRS
jgi:hypothetical protein